MEAETAMTPRSGWCWLPVLAMVISTGCAKTPRAIQTAKPIETDDTAKPVKLEKTPAPAKSDPTSAAVVAEAIKSHTGGKPELLEGWKSTSYKLVGRISPQNPTPATLQVKMVWPDKFRANWEITGQPPYSQVRNGSRVWVEAKGLERPIEDPPNLQDIVSDTPIEWLPFLGCLTDPANIFGPADPLPIADRPTIGVRVWNPNLPPAIVHFDKDSKRIAQITVLGRENGKEVTKEFLFVKDAEFKSPTGILFPDKRTIRINGSVFAEFEIVSVDLPAKIDAKEFEKQ